VETELGKLIKDARKTRGLTQQQLSRLGNVSRSYICEPERGSRTTDSMELLAALARALGFQRRVFYQATGWLHIEDGEPHPPEVQTFAHAYDAVQEGPFKALAREFLIQLARVREQLGSFHQHAMPQEREALLDKHH